MSSSHPEPQTKWTAQTDNPYLQLFLTTDPLEIQPLINFVKSPTSGAIVSFSGTTRNNFGGKTVVKLNYEAHIKLALKTLIKLAEEAQQKFQAEKIAIAHRLGDVAVMEESILIVCSTAHRELGWKCGEWLLNEVKAKLEVWKNEVYSDGVGRWKVNDNSDVPL
ncbi:unnamed protein product [Ambrosiozyma monospora]|uniref:Unnamed protein product n=1 Tax=Ambrosiozyma monospora TaxID=43982 RepID=A0A9W6T9Y6_AMBMO|nr:unnamed protein product [Ambrosiozyma monospora]